MGKDRGGECAGGVMTKSQNSHQLPSGWIMSSIGEICSKPQYGWTTKANHEKGHLKLLRTTDITSGIVDWDKVPYCTDEPEDIDKYIVKSGDILISRAGSIGVSYLIRNPDRAIFASYLIRFRPKEPTDRKYVYYYLKSPDYWSAIGASKSGIAVPNVNASKLSQVPIPLAPLNEQNLIVSEIEKQFSRLDEAVAALKRIKANLKRYKASVLKAAVEGKLTEEWRKEHPDVESASELLKRILAERRKKWEKEHSGKKYKEPAAPDTSNLPELPNGWAWATIGSLIVLGPQNGLYLPKSSYKSGIPILRIDDYQDGYSRPSIELRQVEANSIEGEKYRLKKGDIIINRVNSLTHLGKCLVVEERNLPSIFESNMMRLQVASCINAKFVEIYLRSKLGRTLLTANAKWAVNQASINQNDVTNTPFPLPPEHDQQQIIDEVESHLSVAEEIEIEIESNLKRAERLRQSILKKAFSGRLVRRETNS